MNSDNSEIASVSHPSPHREKVSLNSLWFGIVGAPVAWMTLELMSYILTSSKCDKSNGTQLTSEPYTVSSYLILFCVIAGIIALWALITAARNWKKTRHEMEGSAHNLLEVGEGRTRFLAIFGLLTSIGFVIAFVFSIVTLFLLHLC